MNKKHKIITKGCMTIEFFKYLRGKWFLVILWRLRLLKCKNNGKIFAEKRSFEKCKNHEVFKNLMIREEKIKVKPRM